MSIFKTEKDFKRVIFNLDAALAERLEAAKERSKNMGKRLDVDAAVDKAVEKFLKKAEKKIEEMETEFAKTKGLSFDANPGQGNEETNKDTPETDSNDKSKES